MRTFGSTLLTISLSVGCSSTPITLGGEAVDMVGISGAELIDAAYSNVKDIAGFSVSPIHFASANFAAGSGPSAIVTADFNGDKNADVAVTNSFDNNVTLLLGKGDGTLLPPRAFATGRIPMFLAAGMVNGDSSIDLVALAVDDGAASVLLGNGDGTFRAATPVIVGASPSGLALADFDHDGKLDIATGDTVNGVIVVLRGNGDGTFQTAQTSSVQSTPHSLVAADYDGDGFPDLIVGMMATATMNSITDDAAAVFHGRGDGTFGRASVVGGASGPQNVSIENRGGALQLARVEVNNGGGVAQYGIDHAGTLAGIGECFCGSRSVKALLGPLGGGNNLAMLNQGDDTVTTFISSAGRIEGKNQFSVGHLPIDGVLVDLNGDGAQDIAVANNGSNNVTVLLNQP